MHPMPRLINVLLVGALMNGTSIHTYSETTAEKLGYPSDAKLLIIHADDIGMCHSANVASMDALTKGIVTSGSIMVPCPWFLEIAQFSQEHPDIDLGLHLTLTAEWRRYRWRPLAPVSTVANLLDPEGYMFRDVRSVASNASAEEIKTELRAQIEFALAHGIKPTHLDSHMGTIYARPDYVRAAIELSEEYDIPFMLFRATPQIIEMTGDRFDHELSAAMDRRDVPLLDGLYSIKDTSPDESRQFYRQVIQSLQPGVNELIIHLAVESDEIKAITNSWRQRVFDYQIFTDPKMREWIEAQGVILIGWDDLLPLWKQRKH